MILIEIKKKKKKKKTSPILLNISQGKSLKEPEA
jgi:hypothetical protein